MEISIENEIGDTLRQAELSSPNIRPDIKIEENWQQDRRDH